MTLEDPPFEKVEKQPRGKKKKNLLKNLLLAGHKEIEVTQTGARDFMAVGLQNSKRGKSQRT